MYTTTDISPLRSSLIRVGWKTSLILHPPFFLGWRLVCYGTLGPFFSISLWLLSRASWSLTSMCQLSTTTAEGGVGQRHLLSSGRTSRATPPQHTHTQRERKKIKRLAARPAQGAFELPLSHSTVGGATRRNQLLGSPPCSP